MFANHTKATDGAWQRLAERIPGKLWARGLGGGETSRLDRPAPKRGFGIAVLPGSRSLGPRNNNYQYEGHQHTKVPQFRIVDVGGQAKAHRGCEAKPWDPERSVPWTNSRRDPARLIGCGC